MKFKRPKSNIRIDEVEGDIIIILPMFFGSSLGLQLRISFVVILYVVWFMKW